MERFSGEIFNWLNSDDQLLPGALAEVGRGWNLRRPDLLVGKAITVEASSRCLARRWNPRVPRNVRDYIRHSQEGLEIAQPSTFMRLSLVREMGGVKENLKYIFDWTLYLQLLCARRGRLKIVLTPGILSNCLSHPQAKMIKDIPQVIQEGERVYEQVSPLLNPMEKWMLRRHVRWNSLMDRVGRCANRPGSFGELLGLLPGNPSLVSSRFFWGAVRRSVRIKHG